MKNYDKTNLSCVSISLNFAYINYKVNVNVEQ